jgi:hypothetical protein
MGIRAPEARAILPEYGTWPRLIHLVLGRGLGSLRMAGLGLTLPESRRAAGLKSLCGAGHSRGSYGVRPAGCGVADRVRRTPKDQCCLESVVQRLRIGQTVVKVCCWHQDLSESAVVLFRSFCSS